MGNENTTSSYLDPPQLHGVQNKDGTYTLSALEMKKQSDFNYYVAKMLQGGLNLANLNEATNETFTGMVTFTDLSTSGSTVINGDNITTGRLQGVELISINPTYNDIVDIKDGAIVFKNGTTLLAEITPSSLGAYIEAGTGKRIYITGKVQVGLYDEVAVDGSLIKITSAGNMSIDSGGTIYIGASSGYSGNVDIGDGTGTINLNGTVLHNGVPL